MLRAILLSSLFLNLGLLLGRLSGFFREVLVASAFGASFEADIVVLMLTVPDLMVSLLMGGAMGAMLVPSFSNNPAEARKLLYQTAVIFGLMFTLVAGGLYWQVQTLVTILVPGFDPGQVETAGDALKDVLWLIPLTVLAGVTTAYLHYQNRFVTASLGTLIVNCSIILGLYLVILNLASIETLAAFVLLGGLLRFGSQVGVIRPGFRLIRSFRPFLLRKSMLIQYCQAMLSGSLLFLFPVAARAFASFGETGSVAIFNYSIRLIDFPLAVCISFIAVVLFPRLSQSFISSPELHRQYIKYGIQATLALAVLATITLISLSDHYAAFVYQHGAMSESNVEMIAILISAGLLVLPLQGLAVYTTAIFNSRADTKTPMIINGVGFLFFMGLVNTGFFGAGLLAIMWGLVSSFTLICLLQLMLLKIENFSWAEVYLDRSFLYGGIFAVGLSVVVNQWIAGLQLYPGFSLLLGFLTALLCLLGMALFYSEIRTFIRDGSGMIK